MKGLEKSKSVLRNYETLKIPMKEFLSVKQHSRSLTQDTNS